MSPSLPESSRRSTVDTSVVVAALLGWHKNHQRAADALRRAVAVPAHVLLETYSVLTRMPAPHRVAPQTASAALGALPLPVIASPPVDAALVARLASLDISGGAVYDALVGLTAQHHGLVLTTLDIRATRTYDLLDVENASAAASLG